MPLPSSIQVGPLRYRVEANASRIAERRYDSSNGSTCASIFHRDLLIIIDPMAPLDRQRAYLLHEILHACSELARVDQENLKTDEVFIGPVAPLLLDVLRRSAGLLTFLTEDP